ncbi:hypothetical protein ACERZ8_18735 [Tateyamaria armeniaca]|uniref:Uncharacterized protein n=1 Tax=Tateyamaria armeniaca TaxID=2518930 RepID=A0ABW8V0P0_9RHOB
MVSPLLASNPNSTSKEFERQRKRFRLANNTLLAFSWNDIFPGQAQTGTSNDLVGETFTVNGGGDLATYRDNDQFSGSFGDYGFVDSRIIGNIDGVSVLVHRHRSNSKDVVQRGAAPQA